MITIPGFIDSVDTPVLPIELAKTIGNQNGLASVVVIGHHLPTNRIVRCTWGLEAFDKIRAAELAEHVEGKIGVNHATGTNDFDFRALDKAKLVECVERLSRLADEMFQPGGMMPGTAARYRELKAFVKEVVPYA